MGGILIGLVGLASYILFLVAWIVIKTKSTARFVWWGILGCGFIGLGILGSIVVPFLMFTGGRSAFESSAMIMASLGILSIVGVLMNAMAFLRLALTITHLDPKPRASRAQREADRNVW